MLKPTIEQFMLKVDAILLRHFGMASDDLEDWQWNDYFDDDYSTSELVSAVSEAVADWAYDHGLPGDPAIYSEEVQ